MKSLVQKMKDEFSERRKLNPQFSMRAYAKWLGLSPAQLSQMISGKRPITIKSFNKMKVRFSFSPREEKKYLEGIIKSKMAQSEDSKLSINLKEDEFQLISDWVHFAILSALKIKDTAHTLSSLSKRLGVSMVAIKEALERLERLGIIETKPYLKQITPPLEVTSIKPSLAIQHYHRQNLNMALLRLQDCPPERRQFQSLYLNLKREQLEIFKTMIDDFLDEAANCQENDLSSETYALNIQLFPVYNKMEIN